MVTTNLWTAKDLAKLDATDMSHILEFALHSPDEVLDKVGDGCLACKLIVEKLELKPKKTYRVVFHRTEYGDMMVEARSREEAKTLAEDSEASEISWDGKLLTGVEFAEEVSNG